MQGFPQILRAGEREEALPARRKDIDVFEHAEDILSGDAHALHQRKADLEVADDFLSVLKGRLRRGDRGFSGRRSE
jgi:hypothetical protein